MRIAIIGAGLAGLTCAWQIHQEDPAAEVELFEATDRVGGKLHTVPFDSGPTDMGAEAFLGRRTDVVEFFRGLGLGDSLVYPSGLRSAVLTQGELKTLPAHTVMGIPAAGEQVVHVVDAETVARIDAEADSPGIEWPGPEGDVNLGAVVRERYGDQVVDRIVTALLGGVYSCAADDLGMRATVPQLASACDALQAEGQRVTLSAAVRRVLDSRPATADSEVKPIFATFRDGYHEVYDALAERAHATIWIDAFVSGIERTADGTFRITKMGGSPEHTFHRVVLATPAPTTALLLGGIAPEASAALKSVKLASSAVVGMKFNSDEGLPQRTGVLVAADEPGMRAKAFTLSSRKWPHLAERGGALVRASFGRFGDDALTRAEEDDLVDYALDDLMAATGFDGRAAGLEEIYVQRWLGGLPRFDHTHLATVRTVTDHLAQAAGVWATGAWAAGVGVPAVIAHARGVAKEVAHR